MIISYTDPVGIDVMIGQVQKALHKELAKIWASDLMDANKCYPRAFANQSSDGGYTAGVYTADNEYKEVYYDDEYALISFFGIAPVVKFEVKELVDVHLVVFANLEKVYPSIITRQDERLRRDFIGAIDWFSYGLAYQGFDTRIENVLREYPGARRDTRLKYVDMHPKHCFRLNFKGMYSVSSIC